MACLDADAIVFGADGGGGTRDEPVACSVSAAHDFTLTGVPGSGGKGMKLS